MIASCIYFENCPFHTELKVKERGIFVIEITPRLGGKHITFILALFSTSLNRYGQFIIQTNSREEVEIKIKEYKCLICSYINIR